MAENAEQTKRDALFILDALKHVKSKVIVNAGEIAFQKDVKVNSIKTRFSAIRSRHKLNIGTTTDGFTRRKPSTPNKTTANSQLDAAKGPAAEGRSNTRPTRTPKPSSKKRQADEDGCWDQDGASTPSKRRMSDTDEDGKADDAAWHLMMNGSYDGYYVLDGAKNLGYCQ